MRWENQVWGEDRKGEDLLTVGKSVLEVVEAGKKKSELQDQAEI